MPYEPRISRRHFVAGSAAIAAAATLPRVAYTQAAAPVDVIVIGAGLAGLETALTLEENGQRVLLLEGNNRIGGRVYTMFDVPGHPEAGGNTIAAAYGRMIAAGNKYDVETVNLAPRYMSRAGQELFIDGAHIALKDWPNHARNPFSGEQRTLAPWAWADHYFKNNFPFKELEQWYDPKFAEFDISIHDFLANLGASEAAIRLGFDTNIAYGTTSRDVSLLMQAFADHWQQVNRSALGAFSRSGSAAATGATKPASVPTPAAAPAGPSGPVTPGSAPAGNRGAAPPPGVFIGAFKGGNQNLPLAMAKRLKGDLMMGKVVAAIDVDDRGATVKCRDGSSYRAKAVVSSVPYSVLRHVAISPAPPAVQNAAINTLNYIPITQFHVVPKKAYWQDDGLHPSMWTDSVLGIVLAQRFGASDDEVTSLTTWSRGLAAQYVDRLGIESGKRLVIAELEKMRPAAKGKLEVAAVHSWAMDPFAAGDWAIYGPGQVTRFANEMSKPHQRLYFCGEHTALGSRGMEGALESAERVSLEVLGAVA
ncbi:MAG TPA: NAD(P)/FAD-dependent oxidoreductase [Steroidobacteraceae bacterium]|nr:NAD(P)/FAD-dependent oxidoreductase [Steroidobacteraceae bacterium]HRX90788.1 NAD(P)/FAD-dependent oxidoreductase [Steroidobacteraceae bacterium]